MSVPLYPGSLVPWVNPSFTYNDGTPLAGGKIAFKVAGTNTDKATFTDCLLTAPNPNPVVCDSAGRITAFLGPGGYDVLVSDLNDTFLYSVLGVEDVGNTFLSTLGVQFATGAKNVTGTYTVLATDRLVTVDSSGAPVTVNLPPAAQHPQLLTIKNLATNTVAVKPNGAELLENTTATYTIPAGAGANLPAIVLINDGVSTWWIQASHGF